jgi:hypothetical protein
MFRTLIAAALIALVCVSSPALAQDTTVSAQPLVAILRPWVEIIVGAAVTAFLAFVAPFISRFLGAKTAEKIQKDLHSAAMTGVTNALNYVDGKAAELTIDVRNRIIADAIRYMTSSVPDALKHFGIDPSTEAGRQRLVELASSKLSILAEAPASVPIGTPPAAGAS